MTGYGGTLYGDDFYLASPYRMGTILRVGIKARIIKPVITPPPVMDSIVVGLAQRFDWLQQGIQSFSLFNKIDYAKGESDGFLPSLDEVWGLMYQLPRITGESDDHYRKRLQTYVKVLNGSGTTPITQSILDFIIGSPGGSRISSVWPAKALIEFVTVDDMRKAKANKSVIDSILPGMFAAGVTYSLLLPFQDVLIKAAISGTGEKNSSIVAAMAQDNELTCGIDALVAYGRSINTYLLAAIQSIRSSRIRVRAAIQTERSEDCYLVSAIQKDREENAFIRAAVLSERTAYCSQRSAIRGESVLNCTCYAAIARNLETSSTILAFIVHLYEKNSSIVAAIAKTQALNCGIKARIARR